MHFYPKLLATALAGTLSMVVFISYSEASSGHGATNKTEEHDGGTPAAESSSHHHKKDGEISEHARQEGHQKSTNDHRGGHRHDNWPSPPPHYAQLTWVGWEDPGAAQVGKRIYQQQCRSCHGEDGQGDGPIASALAHPPADLTNHFHTVPGTGDGYLFWRVSEGGTAEPFRSMKSAMPAFARTLNRAERWSVLTYIHQTFHGNFLPPARIHDSLSHPH